MKRGALILALMGLLAGTGWALHETGALTSSEDDSPGKPKAARSSDALSTPAGWRYRQSQPHHWRYIMLKK